MACQATIESQRKSIYGVHTEKFFFFHFIEVHGSGRVVNMFIASVPIFSSSNFVAVCDLDGRSARISGFSNRIIHNPMKFKSHPISSVMQHTSQSIYTLREKRLKCTRGSRLSSLGQSNCIRSGWPHFRWNGDSGGGWLGCTEEFSGAKLILSSFSRQLKP